MQKISITTDPFSGLFHGSAHKQALVYHEKKKRQSKVLIWASLVCELSGWCPNCSLDNFQTEGFIVPGYTQSWVTHGIRKPE